MPLGFVVIMKLKINLTPKNLRRRIKKKAKKHQEIFYAIFFTGMMLMGLYFAFYVGYLKGFQETTLAVQIQKCMEICDFIDRAYIFRG